MKRLLKFAWFPVAIVLSVAVVFLTVGPGANQPSIAPLAAMAPPGASEGSFAPDANASPTEREIALRYQQVRANPDDVNGYILLADAYLQHVRESADPADYVRAQAALDEARKRDPNNTNALIAAGVLDLARHQFSAALDIGDQAVALAPSTSQAYGVRVDALTELGRYDDSVAAAQQMVDLRPDLASLSRVSYQRELHGELDQAIDAMSRAFDASAGTPPENREYIRVLIGDLYALKGDSATAKQIYSLSLSVVPGFVWANAGMGRIAEAQGDLEGAIGYYTAATDVLPLPQMLIAKGEAQAAAGHMDDAQATYAVVRAQEKLYAANGVNIDLELALFEANHGDPAKAVELAQSAYATQPNVKAADAMSWALYKAGRITDAQHYSDEALHLGTPYPMFDYHAGMIAMAQGDRDRATQLLTEAVNGIAISPLDRVDANTALASLSN